MLSSLEDELGVEINCHHLSAFAFMLAVMNVGVTSTNNSGSDKL
jgi:hypothetical protein